MLVAVISSEANLRELARYKDIAHRLARVRGLSDAERARPGRRGQGDRLDRQRPARLGGRQRAARDDARLACRDGREPGDAGRSRERHPRAAADDQPRRARQGRRLVPAHAEHAEPGQPDAVAVPEVHRPRQQPRLLHADAGRDARPQPPAVPGVAARDPRTTSIRARGRRGSSCRRFPIRSTRTSTRRSCGASTWSAARCCAASRARARTASSRATSSRPGTTARSARRAYFHNILGILTETGHRIGHPVHVRPGRLPARADERGFDAWSRRRTIRARGRAGRCT